MGWVGLQFHLGSKIIQGWYYFSNVKDINDVNNYVKLRIKHFFEHYKDLEKGKWVKILGWEDIKKAKSLIEEGVKRLTT